MTTIPTGELTDLLSMFRGQDERVAEVSLGSTVDHLLATVQRFGEPTSP
jgi:hypothetical protein